MQDNEIKLEKIIKANGVLIGSRRWGGWNNQSDYDYAIKHKVAIKILKALKLLGIEWTHFDYPGKDSMQYSINYKVTLNKTVYNILGYAENDFPLIEKLNDYMDALKSLKTYDKIVKNKKARIFIVEKFLEYLFKFEKNENINLPTMSDIHNNIKPTVIMTEDEYNKNYNIPEIDIDEDEIPF